jgi:hypothetical protein
MPAISHMLRIADVGLCACPDPTEVAAITQFDSLQDTV